MAAEVAAQIAFSAIANNDRVGLILFSDRVEKVVPPRKGRKHVLRLIARHPHPPPGGPRHGPVRRAHLPAPVSKRNRR